jgi:hypothetical protein
MACRKLSDAERWQAVGMVSGGMSYWTIQCKQLGHCSNEARREFNRECKRTPRDMKTSENDSTRRKLLKRVARKQPFNTAKTLWSRWIVNRRMSRQTVNRRLNHAKFRARTPIKRLLLTMRHKTGRLQWTRDHIERISGRGRECTGRMKVVLCWIMLMAAYAYGDRETHHFYRNILWAKLHLVEVVLLFGDAFL